MGKKFNLQQKSQTVFGQQKHGSKATKLEQQRIMNTILDDLDRLRRLPRNFKFMTPNDIEHLVHFWKEKQLSVATIGNKLAVLRRFNQLSGFDLNIPSNKELNSIKTSPAPLKITVPENYDENIFHPITRSIIALQWHFGLTKLEAIRLNPKCACVDNTLLIGRTIAHNKKDRMIPIITKTQVCALSERENLTQTSHLLKQQDTSPLINNLYTAECFDAGINPKTPFRQHYAQARLKVLEQTQDEQSARRTLCSEMGFSAPRKLLGLLQ